MHRLGSWTGEPVRIVDAAVLEGDLRMDIKDDPDAPREAALFINARSQAVRIPARWRFPGDRVRISRDGERLILEPIRAPGLLDHLSEHLGPMPKGDAFEPFRGPLLIDGSSLAAIVKAESWEPHLIRLAKSSVDLAIDEVSVVQLRGAITRPKHLHLVGRMEELLGVVPILPRSADLGDVVMRIAADPTESGEDRDAGTPWIAAQAMAAGRTVLTRLPERYRGIDGLQIEVFDA
jgi:virulence-associated protein VagC